MKLHFDNGVADNRSRSYVPTAKVIMQSEQVSDVSCLLNKNSIQSYVHYNPRFCSIPVENMIVLDFGKELHGQIFLCSAMMPEREANVQITLGESISECINTPDGSHAIHQWELKIPQLAQIYVGNSGFRFVKIKVLRDSPGALNLIGVSAVAVFHNWNYAGFWKSNDERINKIWDVGAYTVHLNCQDYIYDGIKRDRMVWVGDLYPEIKTLLSVFDESDLIKKSLTFILDTNRELTWFNGIPSYSCWFLLCHYALFLYRRDLEYFKANRGAITWVIKQLLNCIDGSNRECLPEWRFLDWSTAENEQVKHAGLQGLMSYSLSIGGQLSLWLRNKPLHDECLAAITRLKKHIPDCANNKVAASMQILGNIGDSDELNREILQNNPYQGISTFYGYFVLKAKAIIGDHAGALDLIKKYWGGMLDLGATTFWEDFDLDWTSNACGIDQIPVRGKSDIHADFGKHCFKGLRHSLCHGWAGGPTSFLSEHILGVAPISPGFNDVRIYPQLGGLDFVEGAIPTPHGLIEVKATNKNGRVITKYQCPKGIKVWNG